MVRESCSVLAAISCAPFFNSVARRGQVDDLHPHVLFVMLSHRRPAPATIQDCDSCRHPSGFASTVIGDLDQRAERLGSVGARKLLDRAISFRLVARNTGRKLSLFADDRPLLL
jgi:hypothetical protein